VIHLNFIEVYQKLADDMTLLINNKLNNIARDRTFKAKIIEKVSNNKYKILYKNRYYTARCHAELSVGDIVYVCAPENNWSELFINLPCSRAEFDTIKHQCIVLNNDLAGKLPMQKITNQVDINNLVKDGFYIARCSLKNAPTTNHGVVLVFSSVGTPFQFFFPDNQPDFYKRWGLSNGSFQGTWYKSSPFTPV